jgi:NAD(P)-dependent dehydrogenase (short-subunit alcohol dehydrogenase family)
MTRVFRRRFRGAAAMSASNERSAIVAGAGGELGRATAKKPAAAWITTVGVDRSEEG